MLCEYERTLNARPLFDHRSRIRSSPVSRSCGIIIVTIDTRYAFLIAFLYPTASDFIPGSFIVPGYPRVSKKEKKKKKKKRHRDTKQVENVFTRVRVSNRGDICNSSGGTRGADRRSNHARKFERFSSIDIA